MGVKSKVKKILMMFQRKVKEPVYIPIMEGKILYGRNILISGATGGIGIAIAECCLRNGASVILSGRNETKLGNMQVELSEKLKIPKKKVEILKLDISDVKNLGSILKKQYETSGKIDTLINCAGIQKGAPICDTKEEDYDVVLDTNTKGTYFISQEFANLLIENKMRGNILNISSVSGMRPAISPYMVSKWGMIGMTKGLAKKLIKNEIVVNGIAPGPVATEMINQNGLDLYYKNAPSERFADPMEVANLAVFLISDMGRMIIGETVCISGGCGTLTFDDIQY